MQNSRADPQAQSPGFGHNCTLHSNNRRRAIFILDDKRKIKIRFHSSSRGNEDKLNPCRLTGFLSGESTFVVTISRYSRTNTG
jgi:hypothetical protein